MGSHAGLPWSKGMIRDTSAQDRQLKREPNQARHRIKFGIGVVAVVALLALVVPTAARLFSSDSAASMERLRIAEVKRGTLVRDVSVQGSVVAAISPTVYAPSAGTVTLLVNGRQGRQGPGVGRSAEPGIEQSPAPGAGHARQP